MTETDNKSAEFPAEGVGLTGADLAEVALQHSDIPLLEGLCSTRAIRRYADEPVPDQVLREGDRASAAKAMIGAAARDIWGEKRRNDGYDSGSGADAASPKARMARTMQNYVDQIDEAPVLVLPCLVRYLSLIHI